MRTVSQEVTVCKFNELEGRAKEKAREWVTRDCMEHALQEAVDSLKAFADHMGCRLYDWSIRADCAAHSSIRVNGPDEEVPETVEDEDGEQVENEEYADLVERIKSLGSYNPDTLKGHGDCKLTGVCWDEYLGDWAREAFFKYGETRATEIVRAGAEELFRIIEEECEYRHSDEAIMEDCEANGWEFTANGEYWDGE